MASLVVCVTAGLLLFGLLSFANADASTGSVQCADTTAKSVIETLGGRNRIIAIVTNFVKCLHQAASEIFKIVSEMISEMTGCVSKFDLVEVIKCVLSETWIKKVSALAMRVVEIFKCALG